MMSLSLPVNPALVPAGGLLPAGPAGTVPAVVAGTVVPVDPGVLAAGPADGAPVSVTVLRLVLVAGLAVVAGAGLVRPVAGAPARAERVVAGVAAAAASCAAVAATAWSGTGSPGWTLVVTALAAAVPVLLGTRYPVTAVPPAAGAAVVLASVLASARTTAATVALDAGYAVAAALLAGAVLHLFARRFDDPSATGAEPRPPAPGGGADRGARPGPTSGDPFPGDGGLPAVARERRAGRIRVPAVVAGLTATGAALAQILLTGPFSVIDLLGTGYGRAALAAVVAPAAVVVLVLVERRGERPGSVSGRDRARSAAVRERTRTAAAVLTVAGIAAAALPAALATPAPAAEPGRLLARDVDLDSGPLTLVVTPMRPGPNLVQLAGPGLAVPEPAGPGPAAMPGHAAPGSGFGVRVGDREVPFTTRSGAPGGWALVDLPAGTRSLTVQANGLARTVPVDVGTDRTTPPGATGADGPECASAVLGAVVAAGPAAGTVADCPSEALRPSDEQALRETVRALGARGVPGIAVAADASPRSRAAADAVRAEAVRVGVPLRPRAGADDALVVVSGWQDAARVAREIAYAANTTPTALGGTYLAPWLLTGGVLASAQSAVLPLPFAPQEPLPQRYVRALALTAPGSAPSTSGLLAWAAAAGERVEEPYTLYGAAPVSVPMSVEPGGGPGHHGGPNPTAWFPGGAVAAIGPIGAPAP